MEKQSMETQGMEKQSTEKRKLTDMERIERNERIAWAYYAAYDKKAVKDGATYADWAYAPHATYWSPYFGNGMIDLETNPISVEDSATMEALSYSIEFKDCRKTQEAI